MKKIDTFYLSDKQLEQIRSYKNPKKSNKSLAVAAVLLLASIASGLTLGHVPSVMQNLGIQQLSPETIEMILTGITGFGGIGSVVTLLASGNKNFPTISEEEKKELATEEIAPREWRK